MSIATFATTALRAVPPRKAPALTPKAVMHRTGVHVSIDGRGSGHYDSIHEARIAAAENIRKRRIKQVLFTSERYGDVLEVWSGAHPRGNSDEA